MEDSKNRPMTKGQPVRAVPKSSQVPSPRSVQLVVWEDGTGRLMLFHTEYDPPWRRTIYSEKFEDIEEMWKTARRLLDNPPDKWTQLKLF